MTEHAEHRKRRIKQLFEMAKAYRGETQEELARRLGRNHDRLLSENGNPKLDFLVSLSRALDWPVALVISFIWGDEGEEPAAVNGTAESDFESVQAASREAQAEGRYEQAIVLARRAYKLASTPEQRVIACIREAIGHDGLGRFSDAMEAEQRGLLETSVTGETRRQLESNLSNTYYTLSAIPEAESLSFRLVDWYRANPPTSYKDRVTEAFALYVHGSSLRQMAAMDDLARVERAQGAQAALNRSRGLYLQLFEEFGHDRFAGIANTIAGAIMEVEVVLGKRDARDALRAIDEGLGAVVDPSECLVGDWLESYGWWCIFGCEIAQRHLSDERLIQQYMAKFTDKADVIAKRLGNWALRERVFTMEYASYERVERLTGRRALLTFDDEDLEALVGVVGRFPKFGSTGMKLFEAHAAATRLAV